MSKPKKFRSQTPFLFYCQSTKRKAILMFMEQLGLLYLCMINLKWMHLL